MLPRATFIGLLICLFLSACEADSTKQTEPRAADEPAQTDSQASSDLQMCPEAQRPEVCAQFYKPVCGQLKNASGKAGAKRELEPEWKTYSNGCTACANPQVIGYRPGACGEPQPFQD